MAGEQTLLSNGPDQVELISQYSLFPKSISQETAELLAGFIDLYLLDFKYDNDDCAEAISDAPGYFETCTRNHLTARW